MALWHDLQRFNPLLHLLPRVSLLEPLVAVQGSRNEVVEVVGNFGVTKFADLFVVQNSSSIVNRQP